MCGKCMIGVKRPRWEVCQEIEEFEGNKRHERKK